jgi:hypothetical protein
MAGEAEEEEGATTQAFFSVLKRTSVPNQFNYSIQILIITQCLIIRFIENIFKYLYILL